MKLAQAPNVAQPRPAGARLDAADFGGGAERLFGDVLDREALGGPKFAQPRAEFAPANSRTRIRHAAHPFDHIDDKSVPGAGERQNAWTASR